MADLNALIAQGAQFNLPNPVDQYSKVMQLQQMGQANQLNKLKMDEYTRGIDEQNKLRQVMATPGFDVYKPEHQAALLQAAPGTAPALLEKLAQVKKEQAQTSLYGAQGGQIDYEIQAKKLAQGLTEISNMPSAAAAKASVDAHIADKSITAEKGAQLKASIDATPDFLKWKTQTLTGMLAAKDRLEAMDEEARIASRASTAAPAATSMVAPAAAAALEAGITKEISPGIRVNSNLSEKDIARVMALSTTGKMDFPGERWTVSPAGNLISEPIPDATATNNLAPPVANVNAMNPNAATMQAINVERTRLEADRDRLLNLRQSKGVQDELKSVEAQLKEINAPVNLRAEGTAFIPGRGMLTAAPTMTETQKEQAVLDDPKSTPAQKAVAVGRIAKLNNIPEKAVDGAIERYEYAKKNSGYKGSFTDFVVLSTPKTKIEVNAGQKAEDVEFGQYVVNQYKDISTRADVATRSIPALDINLKILDKGFDTGFGAETIAAGAKVLAALGVQNAKDFATDSQTFLANANSAVLQKQLEQKGVQTAADADRITSTGAQLGNTKEANKFILSVAKAQLQRDVAQRKFYSDWRDENKTFRGAEDAWYAGPGGASLFDSPILKKYAEPVAGQAEARKVGLDKIFKKAQ
jgi:hypothetical protein